jgi:hypothetical protein
VVKLKTTKIALFLRRWPNEWAKLHGSMRKGHIGLMGPIGRIGRIEAERSHAVAEDHLGKSKPSKNASFFRRWPSWRACF